MRRALVLLVVRSGGAATDPDPPRLVASGDVGDETPATGSKRPTRPAVPVRLPRSAFAAAVVVACTLAAGDAHASARADWSAPQPLSALAVSRTDEPQQMSEPRIACDSRGDCVTIWSHQFQHGGRVSYVVEASTKRAGAAWSAPVTLGRGMPVVAIDGNGEATVAWTGARRVRGRWLNSVYVRTHPADGGWSRAALLSGHGTGTQLAAGPAGETAVLYVSETQRARLQMRTRRSGARWGAPRTLATVPRAGDLQEYQLALDARGETIVAWVVTENSLAHGFEVTTRVLILRRDGRPVGPAQRIGRTGEEDLSLVTNPSGAAVLTAGEEATGGIPVYAAARPAGGRFRPLSEITPAGWRAQPPIAVAIDAAGNATMLFSRNYAGDSGLPGTEAVQVSTHPTHGRWSKPRPLQVAIPTKGTSSDDPAIAVGPDGHAAAAWDLTPDEDFDRSRLEVALRTPEGKWQPPTELAPAGALAPRLAFEPAGTIDAVWVSARESGGAPKAASMIDTASYRAG